MHRLDIFEQESLNCRLSLKKFGKNRQHASMRGGQNVNMVPRSSIYFIPKRNVRVLDAVNFLLNQVAKF